MTQPQQGDVSLFQTNDDGNITVTDGVVTMSGGLETATYISLFGGNSDDDGSSGSTLGWWGNIGEIDASKRIVSETQALLETMPPIPANLLAIKDAAERDLNWFLTEKVASTLTVETSMPGLNKIQIVVKIEADGVESEFKFVENWKAGIA